MNVLSMAESLGAEAVELEPDVAQLAAKLAAARQKINRTFGTRIGFIIELFSHAKRIFAMIEDAS
jgi:hypothetical protein